MKFSNELDFGIWKEDNPRACELAMQMANYVENELETGKQLGDALKSMYDEFDSLATSWQSSFDLCIAIVILFNGWAYGSELKRFWNSKS